MKKRGLVNKKEYREINGITGFNDLVFSLSSLSYLLWTGLKQKYRDLREEREIHPSLYKLIIQTLTVFVYLLSSLRDWRDR